MIPLDPTQKDVTLCPTCKGIVKIVRREGGQADHYQSTDILDVRFGEQDEATASRLRKLREGKKTVALVGMAATSCSLAPYKESGVEIWGLNEEHAFSWMTKADRWFQIHAKKSVEREVQKRGVRGHYEWLKGNPWGIPIYMQRVDPSVPHSVAYPLREVCSKFLSGFRTGDASIRYFTSTFAYMMGLALLEGFERIEIYGFEFAEDPTGVEYALQKACSEFWIGVALGHGISVYTPPGCQILRSRLYGEAEQGEGW